MNVTGREWLRALAKTARQVRRDDPELYESLMFVRDGLLDGAAAGVIDLSLPLHVRYEPQSDRLVYSNGEAS